MWFKKRSIESKPKLPSKPDCTLIRLDHGEYETLGALIYKGKFLCLTLEPPWRENRRNVSCIPLGMYRCSRKNGKWVVNNVPGRTGILIHKGNSHYDTTGCILLGLELTYAVGKTRMLLHSNSAFDVFDKQLLADKEFTLQIKKEE